MVDLVYVLGRGSRYKDRELSYSLKSVERYLGNVRKIFFVGAYPRVPIQSSLTWEHLPLTDHHKCPACNINDCLREACRSEKVSDIFLRLDDDCVLLAPMDAASIPYYSRGNLGAHIAWFKTRPGNPYEQCLRDTDTWLKEQAFSTHNFEIHGPILFHKTSLLAILDRLNPTVGYLTRSIYGNIMKVPLTPVADCKINEKLSLEQIVARVAGRSFFSYGDTGLGGQIWRFLDRQLSNQRITA